MANVAKLAARFSLGTDVHDAVVTFHAKASDGHAYIDEDERLLLALAVSAWWTDAGLFPATATRYPLPVVLEDVTCWTVAPDLSAPTIVGVEQAGTATGGQNMYPPQCAFLVRLGTSETGRRTTGRIYLPAWDTGGLGPDDRASGYVEAERREDVAHIAAHLAQVIRDVNGVDSSEYVLAVHSRVNGAALGVTHFKVADRLRTQRRRTVYPGEWEHFGLSGEPAE